MGLDIMIVRGSVAGWRVYDALDQRRTILKWQRPEHETPEAEARRERLDHVLLRAMYRARRRHALPFPDGVNDYIARGFQIYDTPLYDDGLLWDVLALYWDEYLPQDWHEVLRESDALIARYDAGEFEEEYGKCESMRVVLERISTVAKWIIETQNPDEYRSLYSR